MRRNTIITGLVALAALAGCESKLTGNEGNFTFSYTADDDVRDFNKPIAVGAKLDVKVQAVGGGAVTLSDAQSDNQAVLKVAGFTGNVVTVEGVGAGGALISVEGTPPSGTSLKDSVNMLSRVPEVLKLSHVCTANRDAAYLVNQPISLTYDMEMKNGQAVIGYGYWPLRFTPEGDVTHNVTTKDQQFLRLKTGATKAEVTISSTIDATTATLHVITAADIDAADFAVTPGKTKVNASNLFELRLSAGGLPVCLPDLEGSATATTADLCEASMVTVPRVDDDRDYEAPTLRVVKVTGKAAGECTFQATWPAANGGAGLTKAFSVVIE